MSQQPQQQQQGQANYYAPQANWGQQGTNWGQQGSWGAIGDGANYNQQGSGYGTVVQGGSDVWGNGAAGFQDSTGYGAVGPPRDQGGYNAIRNQHAGASKFFRPY